MRCFAFYFWRASRRAVLRAQKRVDLRVSAYRGATHYCARALRSTVHREAAEHEKLHPKFSLRSYSVFTFLLFLFLLQIRGELLPNFFFRSKSIFAFSVFRFFSKLILSTFEPIFLGPQLSTAACSTPSNLKVRRPESRFKSFDVFGRRFWAVTKTLERL